MLYTYSGYENKVKTNLEHRITSMAMEDKVFEVVVPTEEQIEIRQGQRRTVQRKLPARLCSRAYDPGERFLARRASHPRRTSFVGAGSTPTPLPQEEVDAILKPMQEDTPQVRITFEVGERVKIIDGPFTEFLGIVDQVSQDRASCGCSSRCSAGRRRSSLISSRWKRASRPISWPIRDARPSKSTVVARGDTGQAAQSRDVTQWHAK